MKLKKINMFEPEFAGINYRAPRAGAELCQAQCSLS